MLPGHPGSFFFIRRLSTRQRLLPRLIIDASFQILIDGFAISALYALGATGFTLIFGVSGVLNLSHGAIMVAAAVAAWAAASVLHIDTYSGALLGVAVALVAALRDLFRGGEADPEFARGSRTRRRKSSSSPARCCGAS